jgi:signal transduction histidine kinase
LLIFVATLALLVVATGFAVGSLQAQYLRAEAQTQFRTELALLGELAVEPMLRSDYAAVERLVHAWVQGRPYPLKITAVTPNGFLLATAQNDRPILNALKVAQPVAFGKQKLLSLRAIADVSAREQDVSTIARNVALLAAVLVALLGWVLWVILQRTAIRPLEAEIGQRAQKESELRQRTTELETANQELESFSYSISHDLRTPLRAIDGYSHVLSEDYAAVLDANAQEYLARTRAAAQRMGRLIDDLLGLAHVARHSLTRANTDLSALARDSFSRLAQGAPQRQVEIHIADGLHADADPTLMAVVLDNLLGNAWKYTTQTADARIEVGMQPRDGQSVFFVRDNGIGFDMQFADKLFRPFQRLHGGDFPGTGIGLATVQRIILRHGGRIWAEAEPGKGAVFYFTLAGKPAG